MKLTEIERNKFNSVEEGVHCGQIGITIRYGNHFWHEVCGTMGTAQGDNSWTIIKVKKRKENKSRPVGENEGICS